jgi:hypothetical protein
MRAALSVFSSYRPELTESIVDNAETRGGDYVSLLAAGLHFTALLSLKRTMRRGRDIPEENVKLMVTAAENSEIYLNRALHATSQPSVAYAEKQRTAMTFGQDPWDLYAEGLKRCPGSLLIREALLRALRAEWGGKGDFTAMRAFLTRPEIRELPEEQLRRLNALELGYEAHHHVAFRQDLETGYRLYRESLAITPTVNALSALISDPAANHASADAAFRQVLALDPDNDHARAVLGVRHALQGRSRHGMKLLQAARSWGEPYATDLLENPALRKRLIQRLILRLGL